MDESTTQAGGGTLYGFALEQKQAGMSAEALKQELMNRGMRPERAAEMVKSLYSTPKTAQAVRAVSTGARAAGTGTANIMRPVLAGLAAAIVGGLVWGQIAMETGFQFGFLACGIGALVGFLMVIATPEDCATRGLLQPLAGAFALLGIVLGKYTIFWMVVNRLNPRAAAGISPLSWAGFLFYADNFVVVFSLLDGFFICFAVMWAYRIVDQGLDANA